MMHNLHQPTPRRINNLTVTQIHSHNIIMFSLSVGRQAQLLYDAGTKEWALITGKIEWGEALYGHV